MQAKEELIDAPFNLKSAVWKFFKLTKDKKTAVCSICEHRIVHKDGSTSNMYMHMRRKHPDIEVGKSRFENEPKQEKKPRAKPEKPSPTSSVPSRQLSVATMFAGQGKIAQNSDRGRTMTRALTKFIAKDLRYEIFGGE